LALISLLQTLVALRLIAGVTLTLRQQESWPEPPMRFCLAQSAGRRGMIYPRLIAPNGVCWRYEQTSTYSVICVPALLYPQLADASSLKPELVAGLDLLIVRELTGGIYFGEPRGIETNDAGLRRGFNTDVYNEDEIRRIAHLAFQFARKRGGRLCSVDKANVLEVTMLWREIVSELADQYPDVQLSHMYVDNAAMQLVREP
jgi:hypothetical protein